ncbi:MAG TPA: AMP-binding protein [Methylomirabilota bacterium]|nr:AMP-binding protein [Methylomirabilota bacterium]
MLQVGAVAHAVDRRTVDERVLALLDAFVSELGSTPVRGRVALDDVLDRDLGIGSLERVELLTRLEDAFGVRLPDSVLDEADAVRDLVAAILAGGAPAGRIAVEPALPLAEGVSAPDSARTLVEVLKWHAERDPGGVHVVLRLDDESEQPITYGALWARAGAVAGALRARGIARGDAVALMLRTEPGFFSAFFGVLLAGAVPVPIYPPARPARLEEYAARQVRILDNAQARLLVTFPEVQRVAGLLRPRVRSLAGVTTLEGLAPAPAAPPPGLGPDDPALIQYTSGSTGDPKGVLLSHANLLANIRALGQALGVRPDDVCVSWLPLYHDMGLIGLWLGSLYHGVPAVILPPLAFLARPARWLRAISAHRATISAAPNFAFDLCVKRIADTDMQGVDLGSWRLAMNGSEAVSPETIARFTGRFAPLGFRAEAMCPVYGLAESSVGLTLTPPGQGPRVDRIRRQTFERARRAEPAAPGEASLAVVSCGVPLPGHDVRIVDAAGRPLPERVEGRVEFRGPSVTAGYFRNPAATAAVMHGGWMDSGDLGYRAAGELYVSGRRKDVIIKAGRNLYPQEVEELVGDVPGVRKGCVAAFGVGDPATGTERLIVLAETRLAASEARTRLEAAVRERVVDALGLPPDTVRLAPPGSVLKTSSGKIRRAATREAWQRGDLGQRISPRMQWLRLAAGALGARVARGLDWAPRLGFGAWVGVVLLGTMPGLWLLVWLLPRRLVDRAVRRWCRAVLGLVGCRLRVEGVEHLPAAGAVVFAANHSSYLDAVALLAAIPRDFRFVGKRELGGWPLVGAVIRRVGHLTVERADPSRSVADAERVSAAIRGGISLVFFPEGTFLEGPRLLPFRLGAFKAAVEAGCPVVPVTIRGTRTILPAGAWLPRRSPITVTLGTAISPRGPDWREIVRLRDATRAEISRSTDDEVGRMPVDRAGMSWTATIAAVYCRPPAAVRVMGSARPTVAGAPRVALRPRASGERFLPGRHLFGGDAHGRLIALRFRAMRGVTGVVRSARSPRWPGSASGRNGLLALRRWPCEPWARRQVVTR